MSKQNLIRRHAASKIRDFSDRLLAARAGLPLGVASHRSFVSLSTIARCEGSDKSARAATIFIHNGAPEALVGCHANPAVAQIQADAAPRRVRRDDNCRA